MCQMFHIRHHLVQKLQSDRHTDTEHTHQTDCFISTTNVAYINHATLRLSYLIQYISVIDGRTDVPKHM